MNLYRRLTTRGNAEISVITSTNSRRGRITVISGEGNGNSVTVGSLESVRIGRSRRSCELAVPSRDISRFHCLAAYDGKRNVFIVTDYSTNGVYLNGQRLPKNLPVTIPAGTILVLANVSHQVQFL